MLVLTRKTDQSICIGDGISIRVNKIRGNTVQLGIVAPADVKILRGEIAFAPASDSESSSAQGGQESIFDVESLPHLRLIRETDPEKTVGTAV